MHGTRAVLDYKPSAPAITGKAPMDSRDIAGEIMRRQQQMEADRANYESLWQEIADLMLPRAGVFTQKGTPNLRPQVFDSTAVLALDRFSAAFESMLTPRSQTWHMLKPLDDDLAEDVEVKRWCDEITRRLFAFRYSPRSNFSSQIHEVYGCLGAFGTGAIFSEEIAGQGITYRACNLAGLYVVEDYQGRIRCAHYRQDMTAEQAAQRFGLENLPDQIKSKVQERPDDKASYIHCVRPNEQRQYRNPGPAGMAYESWWVCQDARQVVGRGGFRTFPYAVSRYVTRPGQVYGDSPGMLALADTKMLNVMAQTMIQEAQLSISPPLLAPNDGVLSALGDGVSLLPAAINYGGVDDQGRPLIHALNRGSQFAPIKEEVAERRQSVNAAFLVTLFQILVETPQMTATEALLRAQEKGALLAPTTGRQQSELLGPIVEREIDLLARSGALPPPPRQMLERNAGYKLEYDSPLTRAQKADQGVGLLRTLEALAPLVQADPTVMDIFNGDEIGPGLAEINGMPGKWIRSKEERDALREGRQQALQQQQMVQAIPAISGAAKDIAQAQAATQTARF
jgi:hypothetical protein